MPVLEQQQLTNPDNEPPYTDPTTGAQIQKSRVLSGVGPTEADPNRFFDWDETCSDAEERHKIYQAWIHFQPLSSRASTELGTLINNVPNRPPGTQGQPNAQNVDYIKANDPAYTQMFNARDTGLAQIQSAYDAVQRTVRTFPGRGTTPALRFICNSDDHVLDDKGKSRCGGSGPDATQALTIVPGGAIEPKYAFQTATSVVFCPVFFNDNMFPNIGSLIGAPGFNPATVTLDNVDCRERIMLHEFMHIPWVKNFKPEPDYTGYFNCADVAKKLGWPTNAVMPDNYAWYAVYSFWNNHMRGCGPDIWPPNVAKPVS